MEETEEQLIQLFKEQQSLCEKDKVLKNIQKDKAVAMEIVICTSAF